MSNSPFNRATHFSVVWGVTLAVITLIEWRGLDRQPMKQDIMSPFIQREISVQARERPPVDELEFNTEGSSTVESGQNLAYVVDIQFNGPLFLGCFFAPVALFHAIGFVLGRIRRAD